MACPSAAAGPAYNEAARFAPPPVPDAAAPPFLMTAAGPAYCCPPPQTRGPMKEPPPALRQEYRLQATPDADRGQPPDAATQKKNVRTCGEHEKVEPGPKRQRETPKPPRLFSLLRDVITNIYGTAKSGFSMDKPMNMEEINVV